MRFQGPKLHNCCLIMHRREWKMSKEAGTSLLLIKVRFLLACSSLWSTNWLQFKVKKLFWLSAWSEIVHSTCLTSLLLHMPNILLLLSANTRVESLAIDPVKCSISSAQFFSGLNRTFHRWHNRFSCNTICNASLRYAWRIMWFDI